MRRAKHREAERMLTTRHSFDVRSSRTNSRSRGLETQRKERKRQEDRRSGTVAQLDRQHQGLLFEIVNRTARHFAEQPLYLLAAVIAESRESGQDTYVKARGCISQASPTLPSHVQAARRGKQKLTDECYRVIITVFQAYRIITQHPQCMHL